MGDHYPNHFIGQAEHALNLGSDVSTAASANATLALAHAQETANYISMYQALLSDPAYGSKHMRTIETRKVIFHRLDL